MTWLNPAAFAFLAAIPVILLLHSLRYRRRDVQVSTLFLWEQVMREAHGSLGLRRPGLHTGTCIEHQHNVFATLDRLGQGRIGQG